MHITESAVQWGTCLVRCLILSLSPVFHNVSLLLSGCFVLKTSVVFFLRLYLNLAYVVLLVASFDYICRSFSEQRKQGCTQN